MPPSSEGPAADAARDRVQHRKAQHRVGHHQARRRARRPRCRRGRAGTRPRARRASRRRRVDRESHGRQIGPRPAQPAGNLHDACGEPQIDEAGDGGEHGRGRRHDQRPGNRSAGSARRRASDADVRRRGLHRAACVRGALRSAGAEAARRRCRNSSMRDDHDHGADHRGPDHQTAGRIPFEPVGLAPAPAAPAARDSRATRPAGRCRPGTRRRRSQPKTAARPTAATAAAISAAQWLQPMRGDQDRQRREIEQQHRQRRAGRDRREQQRRRRARANPIRTICIIRAVPLLRAVRGGSMSAPTIGPRTIPATSIISPRRRDQAMCRLTGSRRAAGRGSARA